MRVQAWLAPSVVFGLALTVYCLTAPRGLTWAHASADGGDLITAALVLGVPHPSGYPTWTLLAALLGQLSIGTAAWRATLLSMLSGATAAALVAATIPWVISRGHVRAARDQRHNVSMTEGTRPLRSPPGVLLLSLTPAVVAGLAVAFAPMYWGQATVAEVYALHASLAAATLWALVRWQVSGSLHWAAAAGLFLGLGLGNHLTTVWLLPAAGILLLASSRSFLGWMRPLLALAIGLLSGLLVYLYLPLAAMGDPPVNWGNPRTWEGFRWLVTGELYRGYVLAVAWAAVPQRLAAWSTELWRNFLPFGVGAAMLGLAVLFERNRSLAVALSVSAFLSLCWAVGYDTSDSLLTMLPVWIILALMLGVGLAAALDWLAARGRRAAPAAAVLSLILVATPLALYWQDQDLRTDRAAQQFVEDVLGNVSQDALIVTIGDQATFALWYGRYGLGLRPDVAPISRDLWQLASYRATVSSHHADLAAAAESAEWLELLHRAGNGRPVYLAQAGLADSSHAAPDVAGYRLELAQRGDGWMLWRLQR